MREQGDYIDWYCSGIPDAEGDLTPEEFDSLPIKQQIAYKERQAYVREGTVTDDVRIDLKQLGWVVVDE